ncbi:MAG: hypothetical protein DYH20_11065 [Gammaproteobacteria bacterium PRO9]|nr:hypothetical protein [Gammaproteobacteria bacterium PRO9]
MFPSDDDTDRPLIRNEETLRRRDWIDSALAAVRDRLARDAADPHEALPVPAAEPEMLAAASPDLPPAATGRKPARPRLYVVRNAGHR